MIQATPNLTVQMRKFPVYFYIYCFNNIATIQEKEEKKFKQKYKNHGECSMLTEYAYF